MEFYIVLLTIFIFTFLFSPFFEKFKIPWLFSSLFLGFIFSIFGLFQNVFQSETFVFLGNLGMLFLLFMIGLEFDLKEFSNKAFFYAKVTTFIILFATIFGGVIIYYLFHLSLLISFIIAMSFATVGEAILIPILEEFKLVKKPIGKAIITIGVFDDIFEIITLLLASMVVGMKSFGKHEVLLSIIFLSIIFLLTYLFTFFGKEGRKFLTHEVETMFIFIMFVFFLFLAIGKYADAAPIGALLAGVSVRSFIPEKRLELVESEIKTFVYGFFAPIFFTWVGVTTNFVYLLKYPIETLIVIIVAGLSKIIPTWITTKKQLGSKNALKLGIGLCVRFSTSIVIIKYFLENGIINSELYAVLISATAFFTIATPFLFSKMVSK